MLRDHRYECDPNSLLVETNTGQGLVFGQISRYLGSSRRSGFGCWSWGLGAVEGYDVVWRKSAALLPCSSCCISISQVLRLSAHLSLEVKPSAILVSTHMAISSWSGFNGRQELDLDQAGNDIRQYKDCTRTWTWWARRLWAIFLAARHSVSKILPGKKYPFNKCFEVKEFIHSQ